MIDAVQHRGPDGQGEWSQGPVALGHRRLAIIDIHGGKQPMTNEDGRIWLTCNGEIYNYRELRQILEGKGHRFRTSSDSEVIVHAYEEWQDDCVDWLRGMFAFGLADLEGERLLLARDHFGIKPLFVMINHHRFAFASELQSLTRIPDLDLTVDLRSVDQYLRFGYIPAPRTIYQQIKKLLPAHRLIVPVGQPS